MNPIVSVILPVYNCEKYISKCLSSIVNQSMADIEIIVINDGSTDRSEELINKFLLKEKRIKYYRQKNGGQSKARNTGIRKAIGDYVVFVDADDLIEQTYIEKLVKTTKKLDCDLVTCGYIDFSIHGKVPLNDFWMQKGIITRKDFVDHLFNGLGGSLWGKIFKRNIIESYNLQLNEKISMCEDLVFVLEYLKFCNKIGSIKEHLYLYNRLNENSVSNQVDLNHFNDLMNVASLIEKLLKELNFKHDQIEEVISKRVEIAIKKLLIFQNGINCKYSKKEKNKNIDRVLSHYYFQKYKTKLISNSMKDRLFLYLINKNKKKWLFYYSFCLFLWQWLKVIIKMKINLKKIKQRRLIFEEG